MPKQEGMIAARASPAQRLPGLLPFSYTNVIGTAELAKSCANAVRGLQVRGKALTASPSRIEA